jgi:hypothetical protein
MRRSKYPTEREPKGHGLTRSANVLQSHSQLPDSYVNCCSFMASTNPNYHNFGTEKGPKTSKGYLLFSSNRFPPAVPRRRLLSAGDEFHVFQRESVQAATR